MISLSTLTKYARNFADSSKKAAEASTYTESEASSIYNERNFHDFLARERSRITRKGYIFSIAYFQLKDSNDTVTINSFIKQLKKKIRNTDELGWLDGKSIGVYLYDAPKAGASFFVEKVNADATMQNKYYHCGVFTYPGEWFNFNDDDKPPRNFLNGSSYKPGSGQETQQNGKVLFQKTLIPIDSLPDWKRCLDVFVALSGLILLSPFFLLLAIFIKIVSPGPVFFKQERIGRGGKPFVFWKFRTMGVKVDVSSHRKQMAELIKGVNDDKPMTKQDNNPHIIPFGKILRKTCIDEFPQLINIIRGEMSLVGPRPPIPYEVEEYHPWHKERFNILPGLTGLWQVSGKNRLTFTEMVRLDIKYGRDVSLISDLKILLLTPMAILTQVKDSVVDNYSFSLQLVRPLVTGLSGLFGIRYLIEHILGNTPHL